MKSFHRDNGGEIEKTKGTDLQSIYPNQLAPVIFKFEGNTGNLTIKFDMAAGRGRMHFTGGFNLPPAIHFIVNYVPMADIKVKIDNQQNKRDIQLYNQNGKLTDNIALSKIEWRIQFVYFLIYYVVICREDVPEIYL